MSASRVEETRRTKSRRRPAKQSTAAPPAPDPILDIAHIPANAIRLRLNYADPLDYKPRTSDLALLRMEFDDSQVLRYLYRNHAPKRHLEFGTWEGQGALCCLEACQATVWSINLRDGEKDGSGRWAYRRVYNVAQSGLPHEGAAIYQTDAGAFIGHLVREAGLGHRLCQIYCDSRAWDISPYPPGFFDSVLIDGGHDPETVRADTRKALILARGGGLVIWHDFCPDPAVFERRDCSCHGVIEGLRTIWPEVVDKLADVFWVENTWLLVGVRAAELALAGVDETPTHVTPRGAAALDGAVAALRTELREFAARREVHTRLEAELEATRARLADAVVRKGEADRAEVAAYAEAEIRRLEAAEAEQRRVAETLRSELARIERLLMEHAAAAERAEAETARISIAETEARAQVQALRTELARRDEAIADRVKSVEDLRRRTEWAEHEAVRLADESKVRALKIIDLDALRHVQTKRLEEAEATIERLESHGPDVRASLQKAEQKVIGLEAEIGRLQSLLDAALADIRRLQGEGAHLRQSLLDAENNLAHATQARDHAIRHAISLEASIYEIRASTSWRMTEPLRRGSVLLKRKGR